VVGRGVLEAVEVESGEEEAGEEGLCTRLAGSIPSPCQRASELPPHISRIRQISVNAGYHQSLTFFIYFFL
jgi:hypothetical protein